MPATSASTPGSMPADTCGLPRVSRTKRCSRYASSVVNRVEPTAAITSPRFRAAANPAATAASASSQLASARRPPCRTSGCVRRSRWRSTSQPKRPLAQSLPWFGRLAGAAETPAGRVPSLVTVSSQPHEQYEHVVVTAVRCHAGSSEANCGMASAATGQASTHWPQNSQSSGPSSQVATRASRPRPTTPIAATPWTSSHRRTHLAHRMHFSGSRTISGDASSRGRRTSSNGSWPSSPPYSKTRSCRRQSPVRSQTGHSIR